MGNRNYDPINLDDLTPVSIPVTINGEQYELREADANAGVTYRNEIMAKTVMEDGKATRLLNMADIEPLLVGMCLFKEGEDKPVGRDFARKLSHRRLKVLYDTAERISELAATGEEGDENEDRAKNVQETTGVTVSLPSDLVKPSENSLDGDPT